MAELRVDPLDVLALYDGLLPSRAAASAATRRLKEVSNYKLLILFGIRIITF